MPRLPPDAFREPRGALLDRCAAPRALGDRAAAVGRGALLAKDDVIFFYSPGTLFRAGEILQAFTAAARVTDTAAYEVKKGRTVPAWRRNIKRLPSEETPAAPLVPALDFITDKAQWATAMGRGLCAIGEADAILLVIEPVPSVGEIEAGIVENPALVRHGDFSLPFGYEAMRSILAAYFAEMPGDRKRVERD